MDVANWLTNAAGKDFTFLHPEVLDGQCAVSGASLLLQNSTNHEAYRVIVVPSCATISLSNLKKVADFFNSGGTVIFTTRLPRKSAETGEDQAVADLVRSIFPGGESEAGLLKKNSAGGMACFLPSPDGQKLSEVLAGTGIVFDVAYPSHPEVQYIHKIIDGRDVFYFANVGGSSIETEVELRGRNNVEEWDPHTGAIRKRQAVFMENTDPGRSVTKVKLSLKPYHSCFWVGEKPSGRRSS